MKKSSWQIVTVGIITLTIGFLIAQIISIPQHAPASKNYERVETPIQKATEWTCSMHPQIRQPKSGKCPICFMDLIPVKDDHSGDNKNENSTELKLSKKAEKLAEIEVRPVRRKAVKKEILMVGKVDFDESRMAYIAARMPGRIDKLFVNYTGIAVRKGDHMAEYYSPELYVAQKELLQAVKYLDILKKQEREKNSSQSRISIPSSYLNEQMIYNSVVKKLKLWGLTGKNIEKIIKTGKVSDQITLYSPITGIVIHKNAIEGKYFKTGDRLFTIADLSRVWVKLEAYESDLKWLRYGQQVKFYTEAYPNETFSGRISFIDPVLNQKTRTVKVRVDAANPDGRLKPEMFVNAVVYSKVSQSGKVIDSSLADKWISPMHPEVIKNKPGKCDICGMKLVKAQSLGYDKIDDSQFPLVIPVTAPLITGKRAVVYLKSKDKPGVYYGRTIVLGPRVGNYYIVKKGLKEGDEVVVNGNFKIDSALQILARPTMMNEKTSKDTHTTHKMTQNQKTNKKFDVPLAFKQKLDPIYTAYFEIHKALAGDNLLAAQNFSKKLVTAITPLHAKGLHAVASKKWHILKSEIQSSASAIASAQSLKDGRSDFSNLSATVYDLIKQIGTSGKTPIYRFSCPMAFDNKGGQWLQNFEDIYNPYFGKVMLKCGEKMDNVAK